MKGAGFELQIRQMFCFSFEVSANEFQNLVEVILE